MPTTFMADVGHHLRRIALTDRSNGLTDARLLELFVEAGDEVAFEALLRRHGPMVLGVCRRLLPSPADAEDAFQATFLVFVRKAARIVPREMVANWLYGVARLTALKLRSSLVKRRRHEMSVAQVPDPEFHASDNRNELGTLIEEEVSRLPERYRVAVVLCDLEGHTRKEAAQLLGWPEGSLSSRLARARALLAKRLVRHGLGESGLSEAKTRSPGVPATLFLATVHAAKCLKGGSNLAAGKLISATILGLVDKVSYTLMAGKLTKYAALCMAAVALMGLAGWCVQGAQKASEQRRPESRTTPSRQTNQAVKSPSTENRALKLHIVAKGDRVRLNGQVVPSEQLRVTGTRVILYTEGGTKALFVDGKGAFGATLETVKDEHKEASTGPQKMYIGSGPIQIDKADSRASGLGVVQLQSGGHRVSATRESRSDNVHQLEFSGKGNRLFISATTQESTFTAEADEVTYDYQKSRLVLRSKGEMPATMRRTPNGTAEVVRAKHIILQFDNPQPRFETSERP